VNLSGNFSAIKPQLQQQIGSVLEHMRINLASADFLNPMALMPETIPLHRLPDDTEILYRSAIALKLAAAGQLDGNDLANRLSNALRSQLAPSHFTIQVVSPGWLHFRLSPEGLANWLQKRLEWQEGENTQPQRIQSALPLFPAQYAHARCRSLLHLAHQQGLIRLQAPDTRPFNWQFAEPNPIPWLEPETEQLRLIHPAERTLIAQIIDLHDELSQTKPRPWDKRVLALSAGFERFYSDCRIWGEVKAQTPQLAQARLGLLAVMGATLRSLLVNRLSIPAPEVL
jgi:arginyl-tRNA synthetase